MLDQGCIRPFSENNHALNKGRTRKGSCGNTVFCDWGSEIRVLRKGSGAGFSEGF